MRSRYIIQFFLTAIAILGTVWVLQSSNTAAKKGACKESMDASCDKKSSDKMIWENLSQQFFSTF